jgi:hypothetical protein
MISNSDPIRKLVPPSPGSISVNSSTKVPITILPMFLAGRFSQKMKLVFFFFAGFEGFCGFV